MASWQAHVTSWILKRTLKPKLAKATSAEHARKLMAPRPTTLPKGVRVTPEAIAGVPGEWVEGATSDVTAGLTMLYLHGGGYFACSPETHRPITAGFAQRGLRVYAPDYRLAPEHPFPAAIEDAVAVYKALLARGERLVVAGDSAGGGLALALLLSLRDEGVALPAAAVLFSPWTDLAATGDSIRTNDNRCAMFHGAGIAPGAQYYLGATKANHPLASPIYSDLAGLPPLLIHAGSNEVLLDDSTRLADRARAAGVNVELKIWPVVPHVWQIVPGMPEAKKSMAEAVAFVSGKAVKHAGV